MAEQMEFQAEELSIIDRIQDKVAAATRTVAAGAVVLVAAACSLVPSGDKEGDGPYVETFNIGVECPVGADLSITDYPVDVTANEAYEARSIDDQVVGGDDDQIYKGPSTDTIISLACEATDGNTTIPEMVVIEPSTELGGDSIQFEGPETSTDDVSGEATHKVTITVQGNDQGTYTQRIEDDGYGFDNGISGDGEVVDRVEVQKGSVPRVETIEPGYDFAYGVPDGYTSFSDDSSGFPSYEELRTIQDPEGESNYGRTNSENYPVTPEVRERYEETKNSAVLVISETQLNDAKPDIEVEKVS